MMEMLMSLRHRPTSARRTRLAFRRAVALAGLCFCLAIGVARAATFNAALDRDTIALGESATLFLTFTGGSPQNVPTPPAIPNLDFAYLGTSSQSIKAPNGQVSSIVTFNFTLTPKAPGDFTIPALTAQVGGETL